MKSSRVSDKQRLNVIQALAEGKIDVESAAKVLHKSVRQVYRLLAKVRKHGPAAILHGKRGKPPANKISQELWDEILRLSRDKYLGVSHYDLQEILKQDHNIFVGRESLRKQLRAAGIAPKRKPLEDTSRRH